MSEFDSLFAGSVITLLAYFLGVAVQKRLKSPLCNPMLFGIVLTMAGLALLKIDYRQYAASTHVITHFLTPAMVCMAIPLYEQFELLKKNAAAVMGGIIAGVFANCAFILACAYLFSLTHYDYVSLLPKSITTAIGIVMSDQLAGCIPLTVASICITGITGNMFAESFCHICKITDPIAKGVAIGTGSHVIGTAKAMQMGRVEGAFSSLSLIITGILSVGVISLFARLL